MQCVGPALRLDLKRNVHVGGHRISGAKAAGGAGVVASGTLLFTGLSVFWASLIAAAMLLLGLLLKTAE